jgi:hypothetical protein
MKNRKIVFLSIDGILNDYSWKEGDHIPWIMDEYVEHFNHIVKATEPQIVLSSQRRRAIHYGNIDQSGFRVLLKSHGIKIPLAGYLPFTENWSDKTFLIQQWLRRNNWERYVVLDKLNLQIDNQIIPENPGLTAENAKDAIDVLLGLKDIKADIVDPDPNEELEISE